MTDDPHARHTADHFAQSHSQPPPGPDAPLSHEDADALDAWLNDRAVARPLAQPQHEGEAATPASHDAGPHGQVAVASAREFHARFTAAEEAEAPETPVDAIWEQIMATTLIAPAPSPVPISANRNHSPERRSTRHPLLVTVGSHPAATALLVAGVILAIVFVFRSFAHDPNAPIIDYGPAAMIPGATASPAASPPAAPCTYSVLTDAEAQEIVENNLRPRAASDYLPTTGPVAPADAQAALETYRGGVWCGRSSDVRNAPVALQRNSLVTDTSMARIIAQSTPINLADQAEESLALTKALSPILATPDPRAYVVDPTDPKVAPYLIPDAIGPGSPTRALLPEDFVTFPDGRIGAPLKTARIGGSGTENASDYLSTQKVTFLIFKEVNGQWLVDDSVALCTANCDAYYAEQERQIAQMRSQLGTPLPSDDLIATQRAIATATTEAQQASPMTTSYATQNPTVVSGGDNLRSALTPTTAATAGASPDVWLQPITKAECDTAIASPENDHDAAALLGRQYLACGETAPSIATIGARFFSDDFLKRHPETANGQITTTEDDVARAEAITTIVAASDIQYAVTGIHGATDDSPRTDGFYQVFLPEQNTIELADGRFAIPLTYAYPFQEKTDQMATMLASAIATGDAPQGYAYPVAIGVLIFSIQDGTPRIDDALLACLADCDTFWEQQRARIGTPSPSNEELATQAATATAVAKAKLPISSSECIIPTVAAGTETLPARAYVPILKPTDANATEVSQDTRAFIACIESSVVGSGTPPVDIENVLAPFETERRRAEVAAADPSQPVPATDEEVAAGKSISGYLEAQGVTSFSERAPAGVVDPGDSTWPGTMLANGQMADTSPGWYTVPMPGVAVQLGDGRIGIPMMQMITNDDLWALHQQQSATKSGGLWVFAKVGDQWLLDEGIALCIGDCDTFWANQKQGSEWLQPIQANECVPVDNSTYRDYVRPRDYLIVNTSARQDVARQSRSYTACMGWGTVTPQADSNDFKTSRHAKEDTRRLSIEQIDGAKDLSATYTAAGFSPYQHAPEGVDFRDVHTKTTQRADEGPIVYTPIFDPTNAVGLSDGRVAIPTTYLIADDRSWNQAQGQPLPVTTTLTIWTNVGGTWLIDEELPLCIGKCDSLWSYLESRAPDAPTTTPTTQGTPASPSASVDLPIERRILMI